MKSGHPQSVEKKPVENKSCGRKSGEILKIKIILKFSKLFCGNFDFQNYFVEILKFKIIKIFHKISKT